MIEGIDRKQRHFKFRLMTDLLRKYRVSFDHGRARHISLCSLVVKALGLYSRGCWFESTVSYYFSSNSVRLSAFVFTAEDPRSE